MGLHRHLLSGMAMGVASAVLVGCGSATTSTPHSASTGKETTPLTGVTTTATGSTRPTVTTTIPPDVVAIAAGTPITRAAFDHWMYVAAKSQAAQSPGQPVIAPTDPPSFDRCIAQARKQIPSLAKAHTSVLRADCRQLFRSTSQPVMDFLIKAYWYEAEAAKLGLTPTAAQVEHAYTTQRQQLFPTRSGFQKFLSQTGQTVDDLLFRFRVNVTVTRLTAREKGKQTARENAVNRLVSRDYRATTLCTPLVTMNDCGRSA